MGKTETIEEAAERLVPNRILKTIFGSPYEITPSRERNSFIKGAKWQQEKMYTEEDMINFNEWAENSEESTNFWRKNRRSPTMDASYNIFVREKRIELFKIWKEKFKK